MKWLKIFLLLVFLCPIVLAEDSLTIYKSNYGKGGTLQAEVMTSSLSASDISLIHGNNTLTLGVSLLKVEDGFYFVYFNIPKAYSAGEYELVVKDMKQSFTVDDEVAAFNFRPGAALGKTSVTSFILVLKNNLAEEIAINVTETPAGVQAVRDSVEINGLNTRNLKFFLTVEELEEKGMIKVLSQGLEHSIPVFNLVPKEEVENETVVEVPEDPPLHIMVEKINESFIENNIVKHKIMEGEILKSELFVKNKGDSEITDIKIEAVDDLRELVRFNPINIESLPAQGEGTFEVSTVKNALPRTYSGSIKVSSGEYSDSIDLWITIEPKPVLNETKETKPPEKKNISDNILLNFTEWNQTQGTDKEDNSTRNLLISLLLIVITITVIYLIINKLKKKTPKKKFHEYVKEIKK